MSESEHFLSRWSRRKREPKQPAHDEQAPATHAGALAADGPSGETPQPVLACEPADSSAVEHSLGKGEVESFDQASLPPVDIIEATTDVRAFLTRGVPADLTKAALRRAWSSDPAIRDFVGLSENAWDFNAPETIPGFGGALPVEEVRRILARMTPSEPEAESAEPFETRIGEQMPTAECEAEPAQTSSITSQEEKHALVNAGDESVGKVTTVEGRQRATIENKNEDVAVQNINNSVDPPTIPPMHRFGQVIPK